MLCVPSCCSLFSIAVGTSESRVDPQAKCDGCSRNCFSEALMPANVTLYLYHFLELVGWGSGVV